MSNKKLTYTKLKCFIQTSNLINKTKVIKEEQRLFSLWWYFGSWNIIN